MTKKIIAISTLCLSIIIVFAIIFTRHGYNRTAKSESPHLPNMSMSINDQNGQWLTENQQLRLDFLRITQISFAKENENFYVKYQLAGKMPTSSELPALSKGLIDGFSYGLNIDENYFDAAGDVNPGGDDIQIRMSFFANSGQNIDTNKIIIDGKLIDGGPGCDYFTVNYPYGRIFFDPHDKIVFNAFSSIVNNFYANGTIVYSFQNQKLSPKDAPEKVIIDRI